MAHLILIKHALPEIEPGVISSAWVLGEVGREQSRRLAERLREYAPDKIVTSSEPKAAETGRIVAEQLGLTCETANDLHENDRTGFPFLDTVSWKAAFVAFFQRPDELVIGQETANQARERFITAVNSVLEPGKNIAIVAHGTVLSLFVAHFNALEPFSLWEQMACPAFVVLSLPERQLQATVTHLAS